MMADEPVGRPPRAGIVATIAAVAASFFGVRGRGAHERDMSTLNPVAVIATGVALAAAFVAVLVLIVEWVVA